VRVAFVGLLVLAACDLHVEPREATPDAAAPDAYECVDHTPYIPIDVVGTSPGGSLSSLRYVYGLWWPCGLYDVKLVEGTECEEGLGPALLLGMNPADPSPGSVVPTTVRYGDLETTGSFHVSRLDSEAIIGRFVVTTAGWNLELDVDVKPGYASCTL
jgi:hypothetical protein